jgi:hypothetical protein
MRVVVDEDCLRRAAKDVLDGEERCCKGENSYSIYRFSKELVELV